MTKSKRPHEYAPLGANHAYLGRFRKPEFLAQGHNFSGKIRDVVEDVTLPALDKFDRRNVPDAQRDAARKNDSVFRESDNRWQDTMRNYRRRKAQGEGDR